jgi:hypothetical protein
MASLDVGDGGGEGNPVLEMTEEEGELSPFHVEVTPLELVTDAGNCVRNAVELASEFGAFVIEAVVAVYFGDGGWVVKPTRLFDEGMETSIPAGEDGEEPWSCCFGNGPLSVTVRPRCRVDSNSGSVFSRRSGWYR